MHLKRIIITGFLILIISSSFSQRNKEWKSLPYNKFWYDWTIDLNAGFTSYFGDLSQYDLNPVYKLINESKPALGIKLTKNIGKYFGVSGQIIYGGFFSNYISERAFKTKIFEYNTQVRFDLLNVFAPNRKSNLKWNAYAGFGQFIFNTQSFGSLETIAQLEFYRSATPEFVYFFGTTFSIPLSETVWLTLDHSIKQAQNDNMDLYISGNDFDYYSYLGIGVSISINNLRTPFKKKPNCDAYDALN